MFNKIKKRVASLEEAERQRYETPTNYLARNTKIGLTPAIWLADSKEEIKKYKKYDLLFQHNHKKYLITITEDKTK